MYADVAELADAPGLGPGGIYPLWVRLPPSAHLSFININMVFKK